MSTTTRFHGEMGKKISIRLTDKKVSYLEL